MAYYDWSFDFNHEEVGKVFDSYDVGQKVFAFVIRRPTAPNKIEERTVVKKDNCYLYLDNGARYERFVPLHLGALQGEYDAKWHSYLYPTREMAKMAMEAWDGLRYLGEHYTEFKRVGTPEEILAVYKIVKGHFDKKQGV